MKIEMLDITKDIDGTFFIDILLDDGYAIEIAIDQISYYSGWVVKKGEKKPVQEIEEKKVRELKEEF